MPVITGSRNGEVVDIAHRTRHCDVPDAVVMDPRSELQSMCVSVWVAVVRSALRTELDLRLEAELLGRSNLPPDILEKSRHRAQSLCRQDSHAEQEHCTGHNETSRMGIHTQDVPRRRSHVSMPSEFGQAYKRLNSIKPHKLNPKPLKE